MSVDVLPRTPWDQASFNFMDAVTICSDFGPTAWPGLLGPGDPLAMHGRGHTQGLIQNVSVAMAGVSSMPVDGLESQGSRHIPTSHLLVSTPKLPSMKKSGRLKNIRPRELGISM